MTIGLRTLKTAVGAGIAIAIAQWLHLDYAVSAGIIVILSVQNTKKGSFSLAGQRFLSTIIALSLSSLLFSLLGFFPYVFGLFLLLFIPITVRFKLTDGIVVSSVLVTHLLIEQSISLDWQKNELLLMLIGAGIGILFNLYIPTLEGKITQQQQDIEQLMKLVLLEMAHNLRIGTVCNDDEDYIPRLENTLRIGQKTAAQQYDNMLFEQAQYYMRYFDMRGVQLVILKQMKQHLIAFKMGNEQSEKMALLVEKTAIHLDEHNTAISLLSDVDILLKRFRKSQLPKTREEFESRAMLFQFLNDFKHFLEVKQAFFTEKI